MYDVTQGSVSFDGVDVRKLDLGFLRRNVGAVTQDTCLFSGTVLLKDPAAVIFDGATSSLDSISENLIQLATLP